MQAKALILEAPPNVEPLLQKLLARLRPIWKKYTDPLRLSLNQAKAAAAANRDPVLQRYLKFYPNHRQTHYSLKDRYIHFGLQPYTVLNALTRDLRHELVHRMQHRRSGGHMAYGAAVQKLSNTDIKAISQNQQPSTAVLRAYTQDPIETQAYGVQLAGELHGKDWRKALRKGAPNTITRDVYHRMPRQRMLKNAYQYLTRNEAVELVDALLQI